MEALKSRFLFVSVFSVTVVCGSIIPVEHKAVAETRFQFYPRAAWGALDATGTSPLLLPVPYVVVHHTYIPAACFDFQQCSKAMRSMQDYHVSQGWGDIGYNFCVGDDGAVYEGRGWGVKGVHAGPANSHSVGICLIGDFREVLPPTKSLEATQALIAEGVEKGIISASYKLIGHSQAKATECPGKALLDHVSHWPHYVPGHIDFK